MLPSRLHQLLQHAEWTSNFDDRSLQRGADYVQRQRVTALQFDTDENDDACLLSGSIRGTAQQPYVCRITLEQHGQRLTVDTSCSCPVARECKHAAAMLLLAANLPPAAWPVVEASARTAGGEPRAKTISTRTRNRHAANSLLFAGDAPGTTASANAAALQPWARFLQRLENTGKPHPVDDAPSRQFGLLLRAEGNDNRLLVCPAWLRPGKTRNRALVDPQPLRLDYRHGPMPAPAQGWPAAVSGALAILLQETHARVAGQLWTPIHAEYQEQALETVLAHYLVYFERGSAPLQRGESLPLQWRWQRLADGSQRLITDIAIDESPRLLRGACLWYVLPNARLFGRVQADMALFDAIALAPPVLPEHADALRETLQQPGANGKKAIIPLPAPGLPVEIIEVAPIPTLQLRPIELLVPDGISGAKSSPQAMQFGCARLCFDYAGHLLAADTDETLTGASRLALTDRVLQIHRDLEAEYSALQHLLDHDMVEVGFYAWERGIRRQSWQANDLLLQPDERKPPLPARDWKPWLDELIARGFQLDYADGFPRDQLVQIDDWHAELQASGSQWFDVSLGVDVGGERIDLLPILRRLLADPGFPRRPAKGEKKAATWRVLLDEKRSAELPLAHLRKLIEPLLEWLEGDGELRLHRSQTPALMALDEHLHWHGGELLRGHMQALQKLRRSSPAPEGFMAQLRPYQAHGLAWLDFLGEAGLGGILADDMGLGKTVQVLAHVLGEKQRGKLTQPALVVAPTSLVGNWQSEAARFAPALKVLVIHGGDRADRYDEIASSDLVITTYPLLPRDRDRLVEQRFALLVLDEAQAIKNPDSQAARVVREIPAARRLAMTGTPLENHLGELWAQFDAIEPGLLGNRRQFTRLYRTPIEKHADADRQQRLNRRIGPLLLRRRKDDVLTDLPAKTEIVRTLELEGEQRALYETLRLAQHDRVRQAVKERGLAQSGIIVLDALLKLRQACCDPRLVKLASARKIKASAKLDALLELLDSLLDEGRRVLLFSQFTEMLALIETALASRHIHYQLLTGQTPARERTTLVKRFQDGQVPVFLISLKAGGVGLNLTAADTVIHYDPWWNPAAEAQATDRAHRIGQDKPVFVYRLICNGTVEEKIQAMQGRKAELARAVLEGGGATRQLRFDENDLAELFAPLQ